MEIFTGKMDGSVFGVFRCILGSHTEDECATFIFVFKFLGGLRSCLVVNLTVFIGREIGVEARG